MIVVIQLPRELSGPTRPDTKKVAVSKAWLACVARPIQSVRVYIESVARRLGQSERMLPNRRTNNII